MFIHKRRIGFTLNIIRPQLLHSPLGIKNLVGTGVVKRYYSSTPSSSKNNQYLIKSEMTNVEFRE
jgi:hypothetical protein